MAKAYTARAADLKAIRLDVDADQHAAIRDLAELDGLPMSAWARRVVLDHVRGRESALRELRAFKARLSSPAQPEASPVPPADPAPRRKNPRAGA